MKRTLKGVDEFSDREAGTDREAQPSAIDALLENRDHRRRLAEYRTRALGLREQTRSHVYGKVLGDYESRHAELENAAASLMARARNEYQALSAESARVMRISEEARMAAAEAAFRHQIGEINAAELVRRLRISERIHASCSQQLGHFAVQKARFADNLPGLDHDQSGKDVPHPSHHADRLCDTNPIRLSEEVLTGSRVSERQPDHAAPDDMTMILPEAVLVATGTPSTSFRLAVINYVGRGGDNHVQLMSKDVSQRHALIIASAAGFLLKDLHSLNGTFVNGERIQQRTLANGDRIRLGSLELTLRMPTSGASPKVL